MENIQVFGRTLARVSKEDGTTRYKTEEGQNPYLDVFHCPHSKGAGWTVFASLGNLSRHEYACGKTLEEMEAQLRLNLKERVAFLQTLLSELG